LRDLVNYQFIFFIIFKATNAKKRINFYPNKIYHFAQLLLTALKTTKVKR